MFYLFSQSRMVGPREERFKFCYGQKIIIMVWTGWGNNLFEQNLHVRIYLISFCFSTISFCFSTSKVSISPRFQLVLLRFFAVVSMLFQLVLLWNFYAILFVQKLITQNFKIYNIKMAPVPTVQETEEGHYLFGFLM